RLEFCLLDADEALTHAAAAIIQRELRAPRAAGYRLPRREQMFWTFQHRRSRINTHLRLFDRRHGGMNAVPVHAAPEVLGARAYAARSRVPAFRRARYRHQGAQSSTTTPAAWSRTSARAARASCARACCCIRRCFFLRQYLFKRYFLNGWAGYISAASGAWYVFLKYAKLYEARRDQGGAGDDSGGRAS
ncbi:lipopolysaccharide core biosynthesis glycosyl transferase (KdtX), partial [mine drainage metagenome]